MKHSVRPVDSQLAQVLQAQFAARRGEGEAAPEDLVKWFSQSLGQSNFHMTCFLHLPYEDPDLPLRFYLSGEGTARTSWSTRTRGRRGRDAPRPGAR